MVLVTRNSIRLREEPFGSFVYFRKSQKIARLNHLETLIAKSFVVPRSKHQVVNVVSTYLQSPKEKIKGIIEKLKSNFILTRENTDGILLKYEEWEELCNEQERISESKSFSSPVWMHIQPWTVCNLTCKHCYCFASPHGTTSHLSEKE